MVKLCLCQLDELKMVSNVLGKGKYQSYFLDRVETLHIDKTY